MSTTRRADDPLIISRRVLITLAMCGGFAPFAIDAYISGLPQMASEYGVPASTAQLTLSGFLVTLGAAQLVIGPWSDARGRRRLLLIGTAGAAIASVVCALAPSVWVLILGRVLQGALGAAGIVLSRAIVADLSKGAGLATSFALLTSIQSLAPVIAPIVGGVLVTPFGWRSVFWFLTVLSTVLFVSALMFVPESLPPAERSGGGPARAVRQMGGLFGNARYMAPVVMFVAAFVVMFAYISGSSFVLQRMLGFTAAQYSTAFTVNSTMIVVASLLSARVLGGRVSATTIATWAGTTLTLGVLWLTVCVFFLGTPAWGILIGFFVIVTSQGFLFPNVSALAIGAADGRVGAASALMGAAQFGVASVVAPITGLGDGATAVPMVILMLVGITLFLGGLVVTRRVHADPA